jgi:hypothetical protein
MLDRKDSAVSKGRSWYRRALLAAIPLIVGLVVAGAAALPNVQGWKVERGYREAIHAGAECGSALNPTEFEQGRDHPGASLVQTLEQICDRGLATRRSVTFWSLAISVALASIVWFVLAAIELLRDEPRAVRVASSGSRTNPASR